ncbi:ATP-binding protein [Rhodoferax saidenbachensis]|uniref:histidine kinase n=1 Tax=Rhodoferax saidenbachensis TaxID=1484693 RepID=A0ABU1ZK36_9BURK|nr:ATP-binding protein [Rhodoferax saidenbachensis]MDR7305916.1 two-component system sensor histidine kinase PilS (NtrC family) [Rhodoferax saidenbachensis]
MPTAHPEHSWFGPAALEVGPPQDGHDDTQEFARLWQGFMTARLTLGVVLLVLQSVLYASGNAHSKALVGVSVAYFIGTLVARVFARPRPLGQAFNRAWGVLIGLDVLAFSAMQLLQGNTLNYTPLFALPILLASVLGSLRLALGTAAGVTMLLLGATLWTYLSSPTDATPYLVQAALSGAGYFVIALLAHQLSSRLVSAGKRARLSQLAANVQRQVNELVIEALPDGVMIVDNAGNVRAANPAARTLLGTPVALRANTFDLKGEPAWHALLQLTRLSMGTGRGQQAEITIRHEGAGPRRVLARTRLAAPQGIGHESLCVLFLQDQREQEARLRTEKLASMGRLSTAVAHEIRNPLAAIAQANALLDEDITDPRQKKLTAMVGQNAKRLEKIVDDILNVSRVRGASPLLQPGAVLLNELVHRIATDWAAQNGLETLVQIHLAEQAAWVRFDADHLRQVLVNLLDNARRYASKRTGSIQVLTVVQAQASSVSVWSDGAPMDQSVQRHLFEPFFSSESRSSGLGLYICRELCERHGATLGYQRSPQALEGVTTEGNEFVIALALPEPSAPQDNTETPWQTTLY